MSATPELRLEVLRLALDYFSAAEWEVVQAIAEQMIALVETGKALDRGIEATPSRSATQPKTAIIVTAAQEPAALHDGALEADGRRPDVDAAPAQATSEKVTAGGRLTSPVPSSRGGQIASAGASPVPRTIAPPAAPMPETPAPPGPTAPARDDDDAAIARFIAEHGVTKVAPAYAAASPQGALDATAAAAKLAAFEPHADASIGEIVRYLKVNGHDAWSDGRRSFLGGKPCTRHELVAAANRLLRETGGRAPYRDGAEP